MLKVLYTEEDIASADVYSAVFQLAGIATIIVRDSKELFEQLNASIPDLILLDLILYGEDGFEILRKLKQDEKTKYIPVVIFTNYMLDHESIRKALDLGATACINKTDLTPSEMVVKIKGILGKKE